MMDTRNKRASAFLLALPFGRVFPNPDGTITAPDRLQFTWLYAGIAAAALTLRLAVFATFSVAPRVGGTFSLNEEPAP